MRCLLRFVCLLAVFAVVQSVTADESEFRTIFDGESLDGWDGDPRFWRVVDGTIVGQTTAQNPTEDNTFLIWRGGEPADFELELEFKLTNHNSGVQYRSREEPEKWGKWVVGGYQADIEETGRYMGILYDEHGRGILAERGQKVVVGENHKPSVVGQIADPDALFGKIKKDDWNTYRIVAQGNRLRQWINGQLMVDVTDNDPQMGRRQGIIALQIHAGPPMKVQFRNIRLKELP